MKKVLIIVLAVIIAVSGCIFFVIGRNRTGNKTYKLGETVTNKDVQFTLEKYRYVEKVEATCLNPDKFYRTNTVQMANSGCQLVYLEYTVKNENTRQIRNNSDIRVHLEYGKGYKFGTGIWDKDNFDADKGPYLGKVSCDDISPLMNRKYRHIIKNAPIDIEKSSEKISIIVDLMGERFEYVIREEN